MLNLITAEFGENLNATWISTTPSVKALSHDRQYYFLPYWDDKPTMWIRATFPDHRRRMYNSNVIAKITDKLVSFILLIFQVLPKFQPMFFFYFHIEKKSFNSLANVKKTRKQR